MDRFSVAGSSQKFSIRTEGQRGNSNTSAERQAVIDRMRLKVAM